jgi:hypothetical protein
VRQQRPGPPQAAGPGRLLGPEGHALADDHVRVWAMRVVVIAVTPEALEAWRDLLSAILADERGEIIN